MKNEVKYLVNGKTVDTLKEVAAELNKSRVNKADLDKLGVKVVYAMNANDLVKEAKTADTKEVKAEDTKAEDTKEVKEAKTADTKEVKEVKEVKAEVKTADTKEIKTADTKEIKTADSDKDKTKDTDDGDFASVDELKDVIKDMPTDALVDWASTLGLNTYDTIANEGIKRMRVAMVIKSHFFPTATKSSGKSTNSAWKAYTAKELVELCDSNKLQYTKVSTNENIQRMWAIKALNESGIVPTKNN